MRPFLAGFCPLPGAESPALPLRGRRPSHPAGHHIALGWCQGCEQMCAALFPRGPSHTYPHAKRRFLPLHLDASVPAQFRPQGRLVRHSNEPQGQRLAWGLRLRGNAAPRAGKAQARGALAPVSDSVLRDVTWAARDRPLRGDRPLRNRPLRLARLCALPGLPAGPEPPRRLRVRGRLRAPRPPPVASGVSPGSCAACRRRAGLSAAGESLSRPPPPPLPCRQKRDRRPWGLSGLSIRFRLTL